MKTIRTLTMACAAIASLGVAQSASAYGLDGFPHGAVFQIEHTAANAADLTDFQVRLQLDSAAEIAAGRMRADCADLRVYADDGCAPEVQTSFWVADGTCNTSKTDVWVAVPTLNKDMTQKVAMFWGNPAAASMSNGAAVFPIFFDDFNSAAIDLTKWNLFAQHRIEQSGGMLRGGGGAAAIWSKAKVVEAGATVFGVRTDAQAQSNADIEYGASTIHGTSGNDEIHWSSRTYSGVTWMSYDFAAAFIGGNPASGQCDQAIGFGPKWTNDVGDSTFFQTEFFYELIGGGASTFGIYDKFGEKRSITLGSGACTPPAAESAYFQFDHTSAAPNPISSLDYAYVRKYANPDPLVISVPLSLAETCGLVNGTGPCTVDTQATVCRSQHCSPNGQICVPEDGCYVDADCSADTFCNRALYTCQAQLERGVALPADGLHEICPASGVSGACVTNRCNPTANTCADENGASCDSDDACVYNVCDADLQCGYAPGGPCTAQNAATACRSGLCSQASICLAQGACIVDGDCAAGQRCDAAAAVCAPTLTDGSKIPADHGICGGAAGSAGEPTAACASGQCNAITNTCAGANGEAACTTASECVSNACGEDGRCGYADGSGSCRAEDASIVCRSGVCNDGRCGPAAPAPIEPERPDAGSPAPSAAAPEATADDPWTGLGGGSGCSVGSQGDVSWMVALGTLLLGARRKRRAA